MRRIDLGRIPDQRLAAEVTPPLRIRPPVTWNNALLMAHVETPGGPDLRIVREDVEDDAVLRIESGDEEGGNHAQALAIIDESEVILSLRSESPDGNADATIMIGFEVEDWTAVTCEGVGTDATPAMILRNFEAGVLHVVDEQRPHARLMPGRWTVQAGSVPDGRERTGVIRLMRIDTGPRLR